LHYSPFFVQVIRSVHVSVSYWSICPRVCYKVQRHVAVFYWSRSYTWQPIKGSNHCSAIQMLTTQQKIRNRICILSPPPKQIKRRKTEEHIEVHQELHHPRTLTTFSDSNPAPIQNHHQQFISQNQQKHQKSHQIENQFAKCSSTTNHEFNTQQNPAIATSLKQGSQRFPTKSSSSNPSTLQFQRNFVIRLTNCTITEKFGREEEGTKKIRIREREEKVHRFSSTNRSSEAQRSSSYHRLSFQVNSQKLPRLGFNSSSKVHKHA
jgi:hypothetical protein